MHTKALSASLIALALVAGAALTLTTHASAETSGVICTMDAKQCPDGSWVGRTGPNCEFVCPKTTPPQSDPFCPSIDRNLTFGVRHALVAQLQQYLSTQGYFTASASGYFGPATMQAVKAFQRANDLPSTGYFGALTRAALRSRCDHTVTSQVKIYSITPVAGPVGTEVTIDGFGFTSDNTIHFGDYGVVLHVPSSGGIAIACTTDPSCVPGIHQHLTFTVPATLDPACAFSSPRCLPPTRMTTPGDYAVSVENTSGTSNAKTFTVTGGTTSSVHIDAMTPLNGPVGMKVTLNGSGFTQATVLRFGEGSIQHTTSADGTMISFTVPDGVGPYCQGGMMCPMYFRKVTPGTYDVYVQNADGSTVSNKVSFTVTDTNVQSVSISGIDAPTTLKAGQNGTWNVRVMTTAPSLRYSVTWGDEQVAYQMGMRPYLSTTVQTTGTFTHSYQFAGTYNPVFTVTDDAGHSASASATVVVTSAY